MATEIVRPDNLVDNEGSESSGWVALSGVEITEMTDLVTAWSDADLHTGAHGEGSQEAVAWVTLANTTDITDASTINSVQLFVYATTFKALSSEITLLLRDANGGEGLTHQSSEHEVSNVGAYYGFTNTSVNWTKELVDGMTLGILCTSNTTTISEAYVAIDYNVVSGKGVIKLSRGTINLSQGKVTF